MTMSAYSKAVLASTPGLYWPLDINARDLSAGGRAGTTVGGVTYNQPGPGGGLAANFDGSTGFIWENTQHPNFAGPWSMECWYNLAVAQQAGLMGYNATPSAPGGTSSGILIMATSTMAGFIYSGGNYNIYDNATTGDGQWHHIVFEFDGAGSMSLFRDGQSVAAPIGGLTPYNGTMGLLVGQYNGANWCRGKLAHVAFYPRALPLSEIGSHYWAMQQSTFIPTTSYKPLEAVLMQLAGTNKGGVHAANTWAGTTGKETIQALNIKAGNAPKAYRDLDGVCNQLAGTVGWSAQGAMNKLAGNTLS